MIGNGDNPSFCCAGVSAHTQYFFNDLQRVGKEHVLRPVGGASVPSTCRWEGSELRRQSKSLLNAATPEVLWLNSHHACSRRWGKDRLTLCPRLPEDTGALNTRWVLFTMWCSESWQRQWLTSGSPRTTREGHTQVFPGAREAGVPKGLSVSRYWTVCPAVTSAWHLSQSRRRQTLWNKFKFHQKSVITRVNKLIR